MGFGRYPRVYTRSTSSAQRPLDLSGLPDHSCKAERYTLRSVQKAKNASYVLTSNRVSLPSFLISFPLPSARTPRPSLKTPPWSGSRVQTPSPRFSPEAFLSPSGATKRRPSGTKSCEVLLPRQGCATYRPPAGHASLCSHACGWSDRVPCPPPLCSSAVLSRRRGGSVRTWPRFGFRLSGEAFLGGTSLHLDFRLPLLSSSV